MSEEIITSCLVCQQSGSVEKVSVTYQRAQSAIPPEPVAQHLKPPVPSKYKDPVEKLFEGITGFFLKIMGGSCQGQIMAMFAGVFGPLVVWLFIVTSIVRVLFGEMDDMSTAAGVTMGMLMIAPFPVYFFIHRKNKKAYEQAQELSQTNQMKMWDSLYYCAECGAVFLPETGEMFIDMHQIIRATPEVQPKRFPLSMKTPEAEADDISIQVAGAAPAVEITTAEPALPADAAAPTPVELDYEVSDTCWFCGSNPAKEESQIKAKLYGNVRQEMVRGGESQTRWDTASLVVPRCYECETIHAKVNQATKLMTWILMLLSPTACFGTSYLMEGSTWGWVLGISLGIVVIIVVFGVGVQQNAKIIKQTEIKVIEAYKTEYEPLKELLEKGWKLGEKTTT